MFHIFLEILVSNSTLDKLRMYKKLCRDVLRASEVEGVYKDVPRAGH